jgi:hypothetical protein
VPLLPPFHGELRRRSVLLPSQSLNPLLTSSLCAGTCPGSPLTTPLSSLTEASWCAGETRLLRRCAVSEHRQPVYLARRMCDTSMNPPAKLCLSFGQCQHVASHAALICVCMCGVPDRARAASGRVPAPRHARVAHLPWAQPTKLHGYLAARPRAVWARPRQVCSPSEPGWRASFGPCTGFKINSFIHFQN